MYRTSDVILRSHRTIFRASLLVLLSVLWASAAVHAEDFQVVGATMIGGETVLIRTNGTEVRYSTQLSDDKQHLSIRVLNAGIRSEQREFNSPRGLIESCFLQQSGRDVVVSIYFRKAAGFTAVLLPYSRSIDVDIFEWSKVSGSEDQYRSGLIALQNNVLSVAKELLFSAAEARHPDATAFAGFLSAKEGNFDAAKSYYLQAVERKSSIADVYGGLAQVYRAQNDELKARDYERIFVERNGRPPYFDQSIEKIPITQSVVSEPRSLAALSSPMGGNDSSTSPLSQSVTRKDSTESYLQQLHSIQGKSASDSSSNRSTAQAPSFGSWANSALLGVGLALLFIGFIFVRGFLQWKKQQLAYLQRLADESQKNGRFGNDLQSAMAVSDQQAANVYKRSAFSQAEVPSGLSQSSRLDGSNPPEPDVSDARGVDEASSLQTLSDAAAFALKQRQKAPAGSTPKTASTSSDELFDFDESFYARRDKERPRAGTADAEESTSVSGSSDIASPLYNTPGEPQLSSREQVPAKPTPIDAPGGSQILDVDTESLEALAKQLGVDPSLLSSVRNRQSVTKQKV